MTKEELEKEAEEKYSEVDREFITCQDEGEVFNIGYILGAEPREKRIADLEKKVGMYQTGMFDEIEKRDKKLSKAKEIIEEFMITETGGIGYSELYDKAEQFLKDSEVEK